MLGLACLCLGGCYASNVVATSDRMVATEDAKLDWRAAVAADLQGLFVSTEITGNAALSLRSVSYWFANDGRYSGAALVDGDDGIAFQTLSGRYALTADGLALDGAAPIPCEVARNHVRIRTGSGDLILRRQDLR